MKKVVVSAPGKLHLSGEHAVVHGKPAVLVSTSKRLFVMLADEKVGQATSLSALRRQDAFVGKICETFEIRFVTSIASQLYISVSSDIPLGAGMGSSAALSVALMGALVTFMDKPWDSQRINEAAYQAEKFIHINASGSDPAIATHGGILWYRKELDFLKTFWLLPFKIPKSFAPFVLINTGREETTGDLVRRVEKLKRKNEAAFTLVLSEIESVTKRMVGAIHDEDEKDFREAIAANENFLETMGVVSSTTKKLMRAIENIGGVAKISGAGGVKRGSGVVIAMHDNTKILKSIADKYKFPAFQVALGGEGIRKDQIIA